MIMHASRKPLSDKKDPEEKLCQIVLASVTKQLQDINDKLAHYGTLEGDEFKNTKRYIKLQTREKLLKRIETLTEQEFLIEVIIDKLSRGKNVKGKFLKWLNFATINLKPETRSRLVKKIIQLTEESSTRYRIVIFYLCRKPGFLYEDEKKVKLLKAAKKYPFSALAMGLRQNPDLDEKELASIALLERANDEPKDHKTFLRREETRRLLKYINSKREKTKQAPRAVKPTQKLDSRSNTAEITKADNPVIKLVNELSSESEVTQPQDDQTPVEMKSEKAKSLLDFFTLKVPLPFDREQIPGIIFDESEIPTLITAARTKYKMEAFLLGQNESVRVYIKAHQSDYAYLEEDRNDGRQFAKGYYRPRE